MTEWRSDQELMGVLLPAVETAWLDRHMMTLNHRVSWSGRGWRCGCGEEFPVAHSLAEAAGISEAEPGRAGAAEHSRAARADRDGPAMTQLCIQISDDEFEVIRDALAIASWSLAGAAVSTYQHQTDIERNKLDNRRVAMELLRGDIYKRVIA